MKYFLFFLILIQFAKGNEYEFCDSPKLEYTKRCPEWAKGMTISEWENYIPVQEKNYILIQDTVKSNTNYWPMISGILITTGSLIEYYSLNMKHPSIELIKSGYLFLGMGGICLSFQF